MRRGLMAWDPNELPRSALDARVARLQAAMTEAGQDAMVVYTNFIRSGAVAYLTAFSPYWADGALLVPRDGEPIFATTLSKRVGDWIQTVKPVGDLVTSPTPGKVLGERLAASHARRVAILEKDSFPAALYDDIATALPGATIVDGSETFARVRSVIDSAERRLLMTADAIARAGLDDPSTRTAETVGDAAGAVENVARKRGAEEVYVGIAPDYDADHRFLRLSGPRGLGGRYAIRATVAYKGVWVRHIRTFSREPKDAFAIRRAEAWFEGVRANLRPDSPIHDQIAASAPSGTTILAWLAEAPVGTHPLQMVASSDMPNANASPLVLTMRLSVDGMPWCGAGLIGFGTPA